MVQLMAIGFFLALVQAVLPPFLWFFMGDFMTYGELVALTIFHH